MPKTLEKARKAIAKKRGGELPAMHQYSRDSKRLQRAQIRDERLEKIAASRKKHDRPLRMFYFALSLITHTAS
jgi:translation machinery-associated protein 16